VFLTETLYAFLLSVMLWAMVRGVAVWRGESHHRWPATGLQSTDGPVAALPAQNSAPATQNPSDTQSYRLKTWGLLVLAGLAAGLAVLTRSLLLSFLPVVLVWLWWALSRPAGRWAGHTWRTRARAAIFHSALFLSATCAVILPWTIRNYLTYHRFLLVDTTGGYNLWLYNDRIGKEEIERQLTQIRNPVDREQYAIQHALQAITSDLPAFTRRAAERFANAWRVEQFQELRFTIRDQYPGTDCTNLDIYGWGETIFYVGFVLLTIWGLATTAGVRAEAGAGAGYAFKGLFALALVHYAVTTMLTFEGFRFRAPLYPFASVYAGWALWSLVTALVRWMRQSGSGRFRFRLPAPAISGQGSDRVEGTANTVGAGPGPRPGPVPVGLAAMLSIVFLVHSGAVALPGLINSIKYERRYLQGKAKMAEGDFAGALAAFSGAALLDRECACLFRYIGIAHGKLGEADAERAAYRSALIPEEQDWRTRALLSDRMRAAGDPRAMMIIRNTAPPFRAEQLNWAWDNLNPAPVWQLDVGGADIGYLKGFEAAETEHGHQGDITFRWTTDHAYVRLWAAGYEGQTGQHGGPGGARLLLRWHAFAAPGLTGQPAQDVVRVLVNGREIAQPSVGAGWQDTALDLPDTRTGSGSGTDSPGRFVVELLTPTHRAPQPDNRMLGVAIDRISIEVWPTHR
jgi:hypothetical protein